jgi:hypothetical protein
MATHTGASCLVRIGPPGSAPSTKLSGDGGNMLEVNITVDDPDTFYRPWKTYQRYQRGQRPLAEFICAENNQNLFDYHMPVAEKPDF